MRKVAFASSVLGASAAVVGGLYALYAHNDIHTVVDTVGAIAAVLLAVACATTFPVIARVPARAALLHFGVAIASLWIGTAGLPATALFTVSAILLLCTVPRRDWSLFGIARGVGTLLATFFLFMGISELASGLGPTGHPIRDIFILWPTYPLVVGPLLGWFGRRWAAVGGVLLVGYFLWFAVWLVRSGNSGGALGQSGSLLFLSLWALVGVTYVWEWWRHRPHQGSHPHARTSRAAAH